MRAVVFHNVVEDAMDEFDRQLHRRHVNGFRRTIKFLAERYEVLALPEMLARMERGEAAPNALCITFDDGFAGNFDFAFPILAEAGMVATIFVPTEAQDGTAGVNIRARRLLHFEVLEIAFRLSSAHSLSLEGLGLGALELAEPAQRAREMNRIKSAIKRLRAAEAAEWQQNLLDQLAVSQDRILEYSVSRDKYRKLSASEICTLANAGWTLGGHTRDHFPLSSLDAEALREQIIGNFQDLTKLFGPRQMPFAYPYGTPELVGPYAPPLVQDAGFCCAFTTVPEPFAHGTADIFRLGRFSDNDLLYNIPGRRP